MNIERAEYDNLIRDSHSFILMRNYLLSCGTEFPNKEVLMYLAGLIPEEENSENTQH